MSSCFLSFSGQKGAASFEKAGKEPGQLGVLRSSLLFLLETSNHYQPMSLLRYFPSDCTYISMMPYVLFTSVCYATLSMENI